MEKNKAKILNDFEKDLDILQKEGLIKNKFVKKISSNVRKKITQKRLTAIEIVSMARSQDRYKSHDIIKEISDDFVKLRGDRSLGIDDAIIGGVGKINNQSVMFIGHRKGRNTEENIKRNFGMANAAGYRQAMRLMDMAEKFGMPIVTLIDTPGAAPSVKAEGQGQGWIVANSVQKMMGSKVPNISFIIGEGGSGGALAIGASNEIYMLTFAIYSVISPEGLASILLRDATRKDEASKIMKLTATDVFKMKFIDGVIDEDLRDKNNFENICKDIKDTIVKFMNKYKNMSSAKIQDARYKKFRDMGVFNEIQKVETTKSKGKKKKK